MQIESARGQNAHLTHKHNRSRGRHGWLRLTPAYSVKLVEQILQGSSARQRVLDPFSGTATTTLCAAMAGQQALSLDINPFLRWFGNAKLRRYSDAQLARVCELADAIALRVEDAGADAAQAPPIHRIERWWSPHTLQALCRARAALDALSSEPVAVRDLLTVVFCRTAIDTSNASFGHVSMSFRSEDAAAERDDAVARVAEVFRATVQMVAGGAKPNPRGRGRVVHGDSRTLQALSSEAPFDLVLTSPPYPNRMSYIRELRPYMYWTGYLQEAREAGELDWKAMGGTWGIATSRLKDWERNAQLPLPDELEANIAAIAGSGEKNAALLANYVARYFEDAARHLVALRPHVAAAGELHYIVGNSKFYDELVQVQDIYAELMRTAGFVDVEVRTLRKRNSKKELFEYDVVARRD